LTAAGHGGGAIKKRKKATKVGPSPCGLVPAAGAVLLLLPLADAK